MTIHNNSDADDIGEYADMIHVTTIIDSAQICYNDTNYDNNK